MVIAIFFAASSFAFTCEECRQFVQSLDPIEKSIHRLETILHSNEEFIAGLDPKDDSERIKATSNVSIAKKRILAAQTQALALRGNVETPNCKKCSLGEKI